MAFKNVATSLLIATIVVLVSIEVSQAHELPRKLGHEHEHGYEHHHGYEHAHPQHHHEHAHQPEPGHPHHEHAHQPEPEHSQPELLPVQGQVVSGGPHPHEHDVELEKAYEECHQNCLKHLGSESSPGMAEGQCQWICRDNVNSSYNQHVQSASLKPPCTGNSH